MTWPGFCPIALELFYCRCVADIDGNRPLLAELNWKHFEDQMGR